MHRAAAVALFLSSSAFAARTSGASSSVPAPQEPPISTDRPGFLFAPTTVPEGRFQIEANLPLLTLARGGGSETRAWSVLAALRYGLTDRLELRASLPAWNDVRVESGGTRTTTDGFGDAEVGAKYALSTDPEAPLAVLASLRLPTGDRDFAADDLGCSAFLAQGFVLGSDWWLQACAGATHVPVGQAPDVTQGLLAALLSHPVADGWSAYVEAAALPGIANTPGQAFAGAGLVWNPRPDMQLDLSADFGLDEDSPEVIAAFGVSICW